ncbi:ceramide kinase [Musca domestica]|uniref:Ceramide kinase n=1 Tax=Musca domestica TaxID=7370 RepID=A0ABM3UYQ3_MUSDO|nr:ceramide kinase [Musca domestica]XP_058978662.1 ceramide kinase [Musca domestica]XP_058978663.1 ceramide kinase [Musca domestica]
MVSSNHKSHTENMESKQQRHQQQQQRHHQSVSCDILLNTFQIKKKRYKVLLNYDHLVWERSDAKHCQTINNSGINEKTLTPTVAAQGINVAAAQKEAEYEREQLSQRASYGNCSNVVHLREVIRVSKSTTVRNAHNPLNEGGVNSQPSQGATTPKDTFLSIYYAERIVASPTDCNRWHIRRLTLHNKDPYIVAKWFDNLQNLVENSRQTRIKRLLVFINPYGGRKMGLQVYERSCKSTFQLAGIDASCIITQRANQIRDILMSHDLTPFDAVCCVGGDGTVAEMINGLLMRSMQDAGVCLRRPDNIPKPSLPVGIIPAGSTDTVAYSLHGTSDPQTAAIHLVLGRKRGLDVCSIRNADGIIRFFASTMGYGYLGDVAAKSEKYRWMGTKRYEYTGVKSFLLNRGYEAEVKILLNEDEPDGGDATTPEIICNVNCETCKPDSSTDIDMDKPSSSKTSLHSDQKVETKRSNHTLDYKHSQPLGGNNYCDIQDSTNKQKNPIVDSSDVNLALEERSNSPSSSSLSNSDNMQQQEQYEFPSSEAQSNGNVPKWRIIRGEFFMVTTTNITCACSRSPNGMSKYCHLGDGHLDVILVRKSNMFNNLRFAINTMARNGDIRTLPFVEIYRTKQFIFNAKPNMTPQDYNSIRGSCQPIADSYAEAETNLPNNIYSSWNCDGEVITDLEITLTSHRQLIDVFMRGPYIYSKPSKNLENNSIFCCCHSDS